MNLWRIECRGLSFVASERTKFSLHIATLYDNERDVVLKIKQRFTPAWWEQVLITDVVEIGKLHMIENKPLYEED
jgi:hypothetical protein